MRAMVEVVRDAIVQALREHRGDKGKAAEALMVGRTTIYRKIRDLNIRPHEYLPPEKWPAAALKAKSAEGETGT